MNNANIRLAKTWLQCTSLVLHMSILSLYKRFLRIAVISAFQLMKWLRLMKHIHLNFLSSLFFWWNLVIRTSRDCLLIVKIQCNWGIFKDLSFLYLMKLNRFSLFLKIVCDWVWSRQLDGIPCFIFVSFAFINERFITSRIFSNWI